MKTFAVLGSKTTQAWKCAKVLNILKLHNHAFKTHTELVNAGFVPTMVQWQGVTTGTRKALTEKFGEAVFTRLLAGVFYERGEDPIQAFYCPSNGPGWVHAVKTDKCARLILPDVRYVDDSILAQK